MPCLALKRVADAIARSQTLKAKILLRPSSACNLRFPHTHPPYQSILRMIVKQVDMMQ